MALAELLQNELAAMKGAVPQSLCHYLSAKSDACRAAEAAFLKVTEAVAKADGAWATIYLKVISLTALGMSIQQAAGHEIPRKNPARGPAKKKTVTHPVVATEPVVAPTALATGQSDKAA